MLPVPDAAADVTPVVFEFVRTRNTGPVFMKGVSTKGEPAAAAPIKPATVLAVVPATSSMIATVSGAETSSPGTTADVSRMPVPFVLIVVPSHVGAVPAVVKLGPYVAAPLTSPSELTFEPDSVRFFRTS